MTPQTGVTYTFPTGHTVTVRRAGYAHEFTTRNPSGECISTVTLTGPDADSMLASITKEYR